MKKSTSAFLLLFTVAVPQMVFAGGHVLRQGALICDTAGKFDEQLDRLVAHNSSMVLGCGINPSPVLVELIDASLLGASKVYVPSINGYIYVDSKDISK